MQFVLVLVFACAKGCGEPASVTAGTFPTAEACTTAGAQWLAPGANPQGAIRTFQCQGGKHAR